MNIDIRESVINKMKGDSAKDIINTIEDAINGKEELVLPGLGVMLELFWNELDTDTKNNIGNIIKSRIDN